LLTSFALPTALLDFATNALLQLELTSAAHITAGCAFMQDATFPALFVYLGVSPY